MWPIHRPHRAAIFQLSRLLKFRSATQDASLIDALEYIQSYQHTRRDYLPYVISLDFASVRWQALVKSRQKMETVLDRRQLEVCVFHYLALGLQSGDVYVEGSEAYADYRQQLLPWSACVSPFARLLPGSADSRDAPNPLWPSQGSACGKSPSGLTPPFRTTRN